LIGTSDRKTRLATGFRTTRSTNGRKSKEEGLVGRFGPEASGRPGDEHPAPKPTVHITEARYITEARGASPFGVTAGPETLVNSSSGNPWVPQNGMNAGLATGPKTAQTARLSPPCLKIVGSPLPFSNTCFNNCCVCRRFSTGFGGTASAVRGWTCG
jgi:hypothetical protein